MKTRKNISLVLGALILGACASNVVQDTYYSLSPGNSEYQASTTDAQRKIRLTIAHITLPKFLQKQNLVMQSGAHTLVAARHHFWAEPLEDGIAKVLAQEIMQASSHLQVERNFGRWTSKSICSIRLEFDAFHPTEAGQILTSGRFWLQGGENESPVIQSFSSKEDLQQDGYSQVVVQLRSSLQHVATGIVTSIEQSRTCK